MAAGEERGRNPEHFDLRQLADASEGFSGAEIEEAVVSALFDVFDKRQELTTEAILASVHATIPLSRTMQESIEELRRWAADRARPSRKSIEPGAIQGRQIEL